MGNTLHLGVVKLVVHIKRDHSTLRIVMVAMNGTVRPTTLLSQKREKLSTTRRSSDQTIQRVLLIRRRKYCGDRDSIRSPDHHGTWGASGTVKTISKRPLMQNKAYTIAEHEEISFHDRVLGERPLMVAYLERWSRNFKE